MNPEVLVERLQAEVDSLRQQVDKLTSLAISSTNEGTSFYWKDYAEALALQVKEQKAVMAQAEVALARCYDVQEWPASDDSVQALALAELRKHVPFPKASQLDSSDTTQ